MTADQLTRFRTRLRNTLDELQTKTNEIRNELLKIAETRPEVQGDDLEQANEESDINTRLELHEHILKQKTQFQGALEKLTKGTFGLCEICEGQIDMRRLEAHPAATHCLSCQSQQERQKALRPRLLTSFRYSELMYLNAGAV